MLGILRSIGLMLIVLTAVLGLTTRAAATFPRDEIAYTTAPQGIHFLDLRTGISAPLHRSGEMRTFSPNWTPDGERLIFAARTMTAALEGVPTALYRGGSHGLGASVLANYRGGTHILVSPDGTHIAYADAARVWIVESEAGGLVDELPLPVAEFTLGRMAWSPADTRLALASGPRQFRRLYVYDLEQAHYEDVLAEMRERDGVRMMDGSFTWSPDGVRLAFFAWVAEMPYLLLLNLFDRTWESIDIYGLLALPVDRQASKPAWSPDGCCIAFRDTAGSIGLVDLRTASARRLGDGFSPVWSPEGQRLLFWRQPAAQQWQLVLYDLGRETERTLITHMYSMENYGWRPIG